MCTLCSSALATSTSCMLLNSPHSASNKMGQGVIMYTNNCFGLNGTASGLRTEGITKTACGNLCWCLGPCCLNNPHILVGVVVLSSALSEERFVWWFWLRENLLASALLLLPFRVQCWSLWVLAFGSGILGKFKSWRLPEVWGWVLGVKTRFSSGGTRGALKLVAYISLTPDLALADVLARQLMGALVWNRKNVLVASKGKGPRMKAPSQWTYKCFWGPILRGWVLDKELAVGETHGCALMIDLTTVKCWGFIYFLGYPFSETDELVRMSPGPDVGLVGRLGLSQCSALDLFLLLSMPSTSMYMKILPSSSLLGMSLVPRSVILKTTPPWVFKIVKTATVRDPCFPCWRGGPPKQIFVWCARDGM